MKGIHTLVLLATLLGAQAVAQEDAQDDTPVISKETVETWTCFDTTDYDKKSPLVVLDRYELTYHKTELTAEIGRVEVAGVEYHAKFNVYGFDRRWDFISNDESATYAFIIKPAGDGLYYDFSKSEEEVSPSQFFECVKRK